MIAALVALILFGATALALATPVFLVARKRNRLDTIRSFARGAAIVALFCAALEYSSERLVANCVAAGGNPDRACVDFGSTGFQTLVLGGYAVGSWFTAFVMWRQ